MYRIINTAHDRTKHLLQRTAPKFEYEPSLGGVRIMLGSYHDITDEHYQRVKPTIDQWIKNGMVDVLNITKEDLKKNEGLDKAGPTFEEWVAAGYLPDKYPPSGFSEVFSPGLVTYKRAQEEKEKQLVISVASPESTLDNVETVSEPIKTNSERETVPVQISPPPNQPPLPAASASVKPFKKKFV